MLYNIHIIGPKNHGVTEAQIFIPAIVECWVSYPGSSKYRSVNLTNESGGRRQHLKSNERTLHETDLGNKKLQIFQSIKT